MRVLTYNMTYTSNVSYWHTMRQLMEETQNIDWFYAPYDYNGNALKYSEHIGIIPSAWDSNRGLPTKLPEQVTQFRPDLVFMHDDPQRCLWLDKVQKIPVLYWMPQDNEDRHVPMCREMISKCDKTVVVAKFAQDMLQSRGIGVDQIYNPIDTRTYHKDDDMRKITREHLGVTDDETLLLWVGKPGWRKRLMHTIEIAHRLVKKKKKVKLLLHMQAKEAPFDIQEFLYMMDMGNNVILPSDLTDAGVAPEFMNGIYNACDIYIAPHGGEGMCLPICEAMACQKPFIATDYSTTKEFADYVDRGGEMIGLRGVGAKIGYMFQDKGIMRPYVDIDDFVNKTILLMDRPELRDDMGLEGRKFVEAEVDKRVIARKWQAILEDYGTSTEVHYDNLDKGTQGTSVPVDGEQ